MPSSLLELDSGNQATPVRLERDQSCSVTIEFLGEGERYFEVFSRAQTQLFNGPGRPNQYSFPVKCIVDTPATQYEGKARVEVGGSLQAEFSFWVKVNPEELSPPGTPARSPERQRIAVLLVYIVVAGWG
eukprot:COSAG05_NODE_3569_length_1986_cov_2.229995_3_plen_130_part_00